MGKNKSEENPVDKTLLSPIPSRTARPEIQR